MYFLQEENQRKSWNIIQFIVYLKRAHKKEYELSYKRPTTEKQLTIDQPFTGFSKSTKTKYGMNHQITEKITDSVVGIVACDLQPASIVEKKGSNI